MKKSKVMETAKKIYESHKDNYNFIGIRFENKERSVGNICECSRHNNDRNDERDFPVFGTDDYDSMFCFNGTSAWDLADKSIYKITNDCSYCEEHCYIIAGDYITNTDDGLDDGEIVIEDAKVIAVIF